MIELIFAIVIIAISVLSLPMMVQVSNEGLENSLVQEAIFAGSADLMSATSGYWDERSMEDSALSSLSRVIDTLGDCNINTRLRPGHIEQAYHRRCLDSNTSLNLGAALNPNITALNDMAKNDTALLVNMNPSVSGYKDQYTSTIDVQRTNNIKVIRVRIREQGELVNSLVELRAISANIGEIDYYKRSF